MPRDHRPPLAGLIRAVQASFDQWRVDMIAASVRITRLAHRHTQARALLARRRVLGGMGTDARNWPDQWQSTVCAGLICSLTPCPSDENDLRCTCRCHERIR
jgi:hypothetical protein